jgi:carboxypeptidase family protein
LTNFSAPRLLVLVLGLVVALIQPGAGSSAYAADKDTGTVTGVVVVEAGSGGSKPVAGAEVRLTFGSKAEVRRTGADGRFAFVELLAGKYTIKVTVPDGMKPKGETSSSVTLAAGETERREADVYADPGAEGVADAGHYADDQARRGADCSAQHVEFAAGVGGGQLAIARRGTSPHAAAASGAAAAERRTGLALVVHRRGALANPAADRNAWLAVRRRVPDAAGRCAGHPSPV